MGEASESGLRTSSSRLVRSSSFREEEIFHRQASFGGCGSRNTSPLGRMGSRNTSPSRQKTPQCSVFSLPLKQWFRIPFTFLPQWAFWLVGSSGGLVCFSGLDGLTFKTLICNPLTQAWRTLPSMHYNQQRQLIMVVDRKDRSFKIIAASDIYGDRSLPTEVYDSKLNKWLLHQSMPAVNLCSSKMAFCDSRLYLETLSPLGLMMYRLDTGQWEHIPAKFPRSLLDGYLVAGTQKRLFLVGRIGLYSTLQSMRIWELDHTKFIWVEVSRMPPRYFRALLRLSAERFECFGQDNLIFHILEPRKRSSV
ncbi:UNVERIFIED_CONTAM: F-box/kelch-repeat protein [Sesamum latifolium]|uniref:F-box/kelch-repeat protein n=1 Tax=Sesamum latifolium TaxID=2727402 RepID=A0AAW2X9A5_9LAMI